MFTKIEDTLTGANTAAIVGHTRPDGDCVGACLGLYHYLKAVSPQLQVQVYLEPVHPKFGLLDGLETVRTEVPAGEAPDLLYVLDSSDPERIGAGSELLASAKTVICIDHHISNTGFGDIRCICPDASSASEVLFSRMDPDRISASCAACLYTGLAHDTGVFRHSCTSKQTMQAAGVLMEKGAPFTRIILETFYQKTFAENRMLGAVLAASRLHLDGRVISGTATLRQMEQYGVTPRSLDGIVDNLNQTEGVLCTVFLYETEPGVFKVSLRSAESIRVDSVAAVFGGGGHMRAAGCTLSGTPDEILQRLLSEISRQLPH